MKHRIYLPEGIDLRALIKAVYAISVPVGMGFLQPYDSPMAEDHVDYFINRVEATRRIHWWDSATERQTERSLFFMDYCNGRQCKFGVYEERDTGRLFIHDPWYDHSSADLDKLCEQFNLTRPEPESLPRDGRYRG